MFDAALWAYTGTVAVLTVAPGPDTLLVSRNVIARGRGAGVATALGVCAGLFFHALLSALGLSVVLVGSATAFLVVRWAGALYLVFLGLTSLRRAAVGGAPGKSRAPAQGRSFREGLLTNLLNPKVAVFYLALLPQFLRPDDPILLRSLLMAGIHAVFSFVWLGALSVFVGAMGRWMARPAVRRGLEAVAGGVLVFLGARLALRST